MGSAVELAAATFLSPGLSGLLRVWQFAGPACCFKAAVLARGAGPAVSSSSSCRGLRGGTGGLLGEACALPWEDWWPSLGRCSLVAQLRAPVGSDGSHLALDRAWAAANARPELVNAPTPEGKPLILAVQRGRRDVAELLRRSGAGLSRRVADELLYEYAGRGNTGAISLLLCDSRGAVRCEPWACPNSRPTRHGGTPLDVAVSRGHTSCAELLRLAGGRHSLHWAARGGLPADVEAWLGEGACADERDGSGATPLWLAVKGEGSPPPHMSARREVSSASSSSFSSSPPTRHGPALLQEQEKEAAESPHGHCVSLLLEARASVDVLPITMETPLLIAAARGDIRRCAQLLEAGADPTVRDRHGRTPLERAARADVRTLLLAAASAAAARGSCADDAR